MVYEYEIISEGSSYQYSLWDLILLQKFKRISHHHYGTGEGHVIASILLAEVLKFCGVQDRHAVLMPVFSIFWWIKVLLIPYRVSNSEEKENGGWGGEEKDVRMKKGGKKS